jgi:peptidoglycan/LPS O-acetylase OafA/YrhL
MNKQVSAYLDVVRLLCSLVVLFAHVELNWVPGVSRFLIPLGNECLAILFALSGFVIGYVSDSRETTLKSYLVHRAARVYSLLVPCVVFGFVLDSVGKHFMTSYYMSGSWPPLASDPVELLMALFSFTLLGEVWGNDYFPGSMAPYWTLPYEVAYYLVFGFAWYLRGWWRVVVPVVFALAIGPSVMMFLPLWLIGMVVYRLSHRLKLSVGTGRAIFFSGLVVAFFAELVAARTHFDFGFGDQESPELWPFYVAGIWFGVVTLGFCFADLRINPYCGWAKWGAGASATLYLLHFPLGRFVNGMIPFTWPVSVRWFLLVGIILAVSAFLAKFGERRKEAWRRGIEAALARVQAAWPARRTLAEGKIVTR